MFKKKLLKAAARIIEKKILSKIDDDLEAVLVRMVKKVAQKILKDEDTRELVVAALDDHLEGLEK